jgi:hypothetical protein
MHHADHGNNIDRCLIGRRLIGESFYEVRKWTRILGVGMQHDCMSTFIALRIKLITSPRHLLLNSNWK